MNPRLRYGPAVSDTQTAPEGHSSVQRPAAIVILLAAGVFALPLSALFLDEDGNENYILPAAFAVMALVGALVGGALPGLAGDHASRAKGRWVGALVGVGMVVLGTLIFFLLINGFEGG
jgi:peptidoglycan/LPS O-acetylase OafA/YrhL